MSAKNVQCYIKGLSTFLYSITRFGKKKLTTLLNYELHF